MAHALAAIKLILPLPPRSLSPNERVNVFTRARDARRVRGEAKLLARSALASRGVPAPRWERAQVRYTWVSNRGPSPDPDNVIATCKPVLDGLVDAGVLADDRQVSVKASVERGVPSLVVVVVPDAAA